MYQIITIIYRVAIQRSDFGVYVFTIIYFAE